MAIILGQVSKELINHSLTDKCQLLQLNADCVLSCSAATETLVFLPAPLWPCWSTQPQRTELEELQPGVCYRSLTWVWKQWHECRSKSSTGIWTDIYPSEHLPIHVIYALCLKIDQKLCTQCVITDSTAHCKCVDTRCWIAPTSCYFSEPWLLAVGVLRVQCDPAEKDGVARLAVCRGLLTCCRPHILLSSYEDAPEVNLPEVHPRACIVVVFAFISKLFSLESPAAARFVSSGVYFVRGEAGLSLLCLRRWVAA